VNRVEQFENRVSGTEDKVKELDKTVKGHERMLRKYKQNMQDTWETKKDQPYASWLGKKDRRYQLKALTTYSIE
jgi:uncharacterized coiled-coil protein SlyX